MSNDKPVSVILNAAADDLEVNGWRRGPNGMRLAGPHCLLGAIASAAGTKRYEAMQIFHYSYVEDCPAAVQVREHLGARLQSGVSLYFWNDKQSAAAPVVAVLRSVALIAAARENIATETPAEVVGR